MGQKPTRVSFAMRMGGGPLSAGMIFGLFLVVTGTALFIDNLDIVPFRASRMIWPMALLVYGLVSAIRTSSIAVRVWGGAAATGGSLMILRELDLIQFRGNVLWPLVLIAAGVVMLIYRMHWQPLASRMNPGASNESRSSEHTLREFALFSQVKRRVQSPAFEGGELSATFGGIEIDLRHAEISNEDRRVILEATTAFGGIEIRVPEHWRVSVEGTAVFGQFEDKTIPPRPEPGVTTPVLVIRGGVAFGAVVLMN